MLMVVQARITGVPEAGCPATGVWATSVVAAVAAVAASAMPVCFPTPDVAAAGAMAGLAHRAQLEMMAAMAGLGSILAAA
jgi:hypothetical protein